MSPRAAGVLVMIGAIVVALCGGWLIATPPWSIPGALVLVGAMILFAVGSTWLVRPSWADRTWPPQRPADPARSRRRLRRLLISRAVTVPLVLGGAVFMIVEGQPLLGGLLLLVGLMNGLSSVWLAVLARRVWETGERDTTSRST